MIRGVRVGHWTGNYTGCTVVVFPEGTIGSGEVRGGAPATREFALLDPTKKVATIDAVVMTGGSVFGLAAADGVVRALRQDDRGFETSAGRIPIVPTMALFDLSADRFEPPDAYAGESAYRDAHELFELGAFGAGAGARLGRWRGTEGNRQGGLGFASLADGDLVVAALVAVNSVGEHDVDDLVAVAIEWTADASPLENTTLVTIATNAIMTKVECHLVAQSGHDGVARALFPAHTSADGDAVVVGCTCEVEANSEKVRSLAVLAVERAIINAGG